MTQALEDICHFFGACFYYRLLVDCKWWFFLNLGKRLCLSDGCRRYGGTNGYRIVLGAVAGELSPSIKGLLAYACSDFNLKDFPETTWKANNKF